MQGTWVYKPHSSSACVPQLLSPPATTTEPESHDDWSPGTLRTVLSNKRSPHSERPVHLNEEQPQLASAGESLRSAGQTQHSQEWINKLKKKKRKGQLLLHRCFQDPYTIPQSHLVSLNVPQSTEFTADKGVNIHTLSIVALDLRLKASGSSSLSRESLALYKHLPKRLTVG